MNFYTTWCRPCERLAPEYAKAAKILKESDIPVPFAKVDAEIAVQTTKKYDIYYIPQIILFSKFKRISYFGGRTHS